MSFGNGDSSGAVGGFQNKFVSQDELDEKRKKRQEEWEKVRKPEDPKEAPEEEYDNRSLFERLEEQKLKKQEEYEEQYALKNQVKGLGEDEVQFLDFVSQRQEELDKERLKEDAQVLNEYRSAVASESLEKVDSQKKTPAESKASRLAPQGKKSQQSLLMGAVKRKSTNTEDKQPEASVEKKTKESETSQTSATSSVTENNGLAKVIGFLPGLGAYDDSSDEKNTSSDSTSDDEEGLGIMLPKKVIIIEQRQ